MIPSKQENNWYVLHTRSRFENVTSTDLTRKRFEVFLPKKRVRSKRRDRKLMIDVPLFNGYIFVRTILTPQTHLDILKTNGAVRLIGYNDGPVPVETEAIESLKIMVAQKEEIITGKLLKKGDLIRVTQGPFKGLIGNFLNYKGASSIAVHIDALAQFASIQIHEGDIELITP